MFVVPAVEVYVERNDAAGCHASDQRPEGGAHKCKKKKYVMKKMLHMHKKVCKNKYKAFSQLISRMHSY